MSLPFELKVPILELQVYDFAARVSDLSFASWACPWRS